MGIPRAASRTGHSSVLAASDGRSAGAWSILPPVPQLAITEIVAFRSNLLSRLVRFHAAFEYLAVGPPTNMLDKDLCADLVLRPWGRS